MRILFAFYPLFVRYNYGIALLSSLCKARGIEVDLCVLGTLDEFQRQLAHASSRVVGFSCVTVHDYKLCVPYMRTAKALGHTVLLGGVWAGLGQPVDPCVDFVCRGDGEALPDFLLHGDTSLFDSPHICRDIHALPLADYGLFQNIPFERDSLFAGKKVLPYQSSRGCNGCCTFCQIRHQPRGVRVRSRVQEDLEHLRDTYAPDLFFMGDAGLPYQNTAWEASWGDFTHPFFAYIRADIRPVDLHWLIDRGMAGCAFGVEAGDESYRNDVLRKNLTDVELWRTVGILEKRGVTPVSFFMQDTPGETPELQRKTRALAATLPGLSFTFRYEALGVCA